MEKQVFKYILAGLFIVGFFMTLGFLMFKPMPNGSDKLLYLMLGFLISGAGTVINFYFGSSKSSEDKTAMIHK